MDDLSTLAGPGDQTAAMDWMKGLLPDQRELLASTMTHSRPMQKEPTSLSDMYAKAKGPFPEQAPYQPGEPIADYVKRDFPETAQAAGGFGGITGGVKVGGAGTRMGHLGKNAPEALAQRAGNENVSGLPRSLEDVSKQYGSEFVQQAKPKASPLERMWQNHGRHLSPEEVIGSEQIWEGANKAAWAGLDRAESFAHLANYMWQRMGANRYMTPEMARRYIAVEEAKERGIRIVE